MIKDFCHPGNRLLPSEPKKIVFYVYWWLCIIFFLDSGGLSQLPLSLPLSVVSVCVSESQFLISMSHQNQAHHLTFPALSRNKNKSCFLS